ncbi:glutathione S-transferase F11-like [Zingiber officinale]|uniref:glutathione transferase n=1 Tax=Zingiber officinale TaxID=94328 RepID=A0A8J5H093_ZINOF|nr:glutathione S-transferase F11-like [Zingiber officinale]KAG6514031.1 hypothetical protein ZIOFF_024370 [Zingiber officinale]
MPLVLTSRCILITRGAELDQIAMVVKVYGEARAVCPQRVIHCLVEKGVPFELVHVELDSMEQKRPEFMEKQPFGQVPYVVDGEFELFESRAIARYYASKYADYGPSLLGRTVEERAKVEQWMDVEAMNYNPVAFSIVWNAFILPARGLARKEEKAAAAARKLEAILEVYEKQLAKSRYLAGDEFTLADLTHIPATRYVVENCNMAHVMEGKQHLKAWWDNITARPGWKKVMEFVETGANKHQP